MNVYGSINSRSENCMSFLPFLHDVNQTNYIEKIKLSNPKSDSKLYDFSMLVKKILISNLENGTMDYKDFTSIKTVFPSIAEETYALSSLTIIKILKTSPDELKDDINFISNFCSLYRRKTIEEKIDGKRVTRYEYKKNDNIYGLSLLAIKVIFSNYQAVINKTIDMLTNNDLNKINEVYNKLISPDENEIKNYIKWVFYNNFSYLENEDSCFYEYYKKLSKNIFKYSIRRCKSLIINHSITEEENSRRPFFKSYDLKKLQHKRIN